MTAKCVRDALSLCVELIVSSVVLTVEDTIDSTIFSKT